MRITSRTYAVATMWTGIVATLGGNAASADWGDPLAVIISVTPAIGLAAVFEMTSHSKIIPSRRRWHHKAARLIPALAIMGIAAWGSYGHTLRTMQAHGQHGLAACLMACLPDAMMLLAAAYLKDSARPPAKTTRVRKPVKAPARARKPVKAPARTAAPAAVATPVVVAAGPRRGHLRLIPSGGVPQLSPSPA